MVKISFEQLCFEMESLLSGCGVNSPKASVARGINRQTSVVHHLHFNINNSQILSCHSIADRQSHDAFGRTSPIDTPEWEPQIPVVSRLFNYAVFAFMHLVEEKFWPELPVQYHTCIFIAHQTRDNMQCLPVKPPFGDIWAFLNSNIFWSSSNICCETHLKRQQT